MDTCYNSIIIRNVSKLIVLVRDNTLVVNNVSCDVSSVNIMETTGLGCITIVDTKYGHLL